MYFGLAPGVHLGRHRIGWLNLKNSAQAPQTALNFSANPSAGFFPKWTMTLNQNTYCAPLIANSQSFLKTYAECYKYHKQD
jgi:hypothetical protein